jgi:glycosyltransferase involved in cell wall biosynthesis
MDFKLARTPIINQIGKWFLANYLRLMEQLACWRAEHIIAISEVDKQKFMRKYSIRENKITIIPTPMAVDDYKEKLSKESAEADKITVIFHGGYRHPANYEAFQLIKDYIAPEVQRFNSNIKFVLAGTDLPPFERENVKSLGYVEDLSIVLRESDIAIVPVLQGTGVRIKIFDYMAAGLPIITTKQGIEGIGAENDKHAIILDIVDDNFIKAILSLASDKQRREMLGRNAQELIQKDYTRQGIQTKLDEMLAKIRQIRG